MIADTTKLQGHLHIIKPYKRVVFSLLILALMAAILDGVSAGLLVPLVSSLQPDQDYSKLPYLVRIATTLFVDHDIEGRILYSVTAFVLAIVLKNTFWGLSLYLATWLSSRVTADLRSQGMGMLMNVGIGYFNTTRTGDLAERILNNTSATENLIMHGTEFVVNCASFIVLISFLFLFSWKLTLGALFFAVVIAVVNTVFIRLLSRTAQTSATLNRDVSSYLYESISGIRLIKTYVKERHVESHFRELTEKHRKTDHMLNFGQYLIHVLTETLGVIAIGVMFVVALIVFKISSITLITQLVPFVYILMRIIPTITVLNQTRASIAVSLPFLALTCELLRTDDKPFIQDGKEQFEGLKQGITFSKVGFSYEASDKPVLSDVSFFIPKGKTTAIVGQSGSGKSTILNLLIRLYDPQKGEVLIDGQPLCALRKASYLKSMSIVSQDTFIFNTTVGENIAFGALGTAPETDIVEAARLAGAHEFIKQLPNGYDTVLGDNGIRLSGGQRQRISIARAILKDPEILILDEATSSLDTKTELQVHEAVLDMIEGRTVIIVAHRLSTIRSADQIVVLKNGKVTETGTESQLLTNNDEYSSLTRKT